MSKNAELLALIDRAVDEILLEFDVDKPPVPVELMLQRPRADTWSEIDLTEMSVTFLNMFDRFAPRMSAVRLLARNIARSDWGKERGLEVLLREGEWINLFARAIIIPRSLLEVVDESQHQREIVSLRFEVPEEDAEARLRDLGEK